MSQRVLIVEDNRAMSSVLRFNMQAGYEVVVGNNGLEGLDLLKQHQVDFVISDYQMPRMGGYDFALHMRQIPGYESTPINVFRQRVRTELRRIIPKRFELSNCFINRSVPERSFPLSMKLFERRKPGLTATLIS
ncbi:MAG: response regulator [Planctomycetaceae bacterium]